MPGGSANVPRRYLCKVPPKRYARRKLIRQHPQENHVYCIQCVAWSLYGTDNFAAVLQVWDANATEDASFRLTHRTALPLNPAAFVKRSMEDSEGDKAVSGGELRRVLGAFDLLMLGIGGIIGAGVFVLTGVAARQLAGCGSCWNARFACSPRVRTQTPSPRLWNSPVPVGSA